MLHVLTHTSPLCTHLQDYHSLLFGSGRSLASLSTHVSHALCLPVSLSEVLEVNQMEGESEVCPPTLTQHLASWWFRSNPTGSTHAHLQLLTEIINGL